MIDHPDFEPLLELQRRISYLESALVLLGWDQETGMPAGGSEDRAGCIGELTGVVHDLATSRELGDALARAEGAAGDLSTREATALVRETRRRYDRRSRVPVELAREIAKTSAQSLPAWKEAREKNEFPIFLPYLEKMFVLRRSEAEAINDSGDLYDTLLEDYEPGTCSETIQRHIDTVKPVLVELVAEIAPLSARVPASTLEGHYPLDLQQSFGRQVIATMGFDFGRGRVDTSVHPFCSDISSPGDVRLTTRYSEKNFTQALFGLMHEAGHGLYEQGLDPAWRHTPVGNAVSMGIHESQSRLWENNIGRSRAFWQHFRPILEQHFGAHAESLRSVDETTFLRAINRVEPTFIRVEADEVTYNLHVMLRYEVEKALLGGDLPFGELPGFWNQKTQEYLGITPRSDSDGCLQDIHWSFGCVGYFPTYFLGNLYAAQIHVAAERALPELEAQVASGELRPLRDWLGGQVHRAGSLHAPEDLCQAVTGERLESRYFIEYLTHKMREVHAA